MLKGLIKILKDAAFPTRCNGCDQLYRSSPRDPSASATGSMDAALVAWVADYFCNACVRTAWVTSPLCTQCGRPFASAQGMDHLCGHCTREPFSFDEARAAGKYQHALRSLIQDFKYRGREYLAGPLGRLLWETMVKNWNPTDFDWILPVPLHRRRLYRRGFNQAELMVRGWPKVAGEAGIAFDHKKITSRMMIRHRHTLSQTGLGRLERVANLRQAFRMRDLVSVCGKRMLIVDDVFTTGATVNACSRVLKRAGAASVKVLTLARAV